MTRCDYSSDVHWHALPIRELGFSSRITHALIWLSRHRHADDGDDDADADEPASGKEWLGADIAALSDEELLRGNGIGKSTLAQIRARFAVLDAVARDPDTPACDAHWMVRSWSWGREVRTCDAHLAQAVGSIVADRTLRRDRNAIVFPLADWNWKGR